MATKIAATHKQHWKAMLITKCLTVVVNAKSILMFGHRPADKYFSYLGHNKASAKHIEGYTNEGFVQDMFVLSGNTRYVTDLNYLITIQEKE